MFLARVEGTVVATHKHPSLRGARLLLCTPIESVGDPKAIPIIAFDQHGAGKYQTVIVSSDGAGARAALNDPKSPARYMVIGIVDETEAKRA